MTVWLYASTSTLPGPFLPVSRRLRLQMPPPSPMHIKPPADCTSALLPILQPPMQADQNESFGPSPTARKLVNPLTKRANRPFIKPVPLTSFHLVHIPLRSFLSSMPYLCNELGGPGEANANKRVSMSFCVP